VDSDIRQRSFGLRPQDDNNVASVGFMMHGSFDSLRSLRISLRSTHCLKPQYDNLKMKLCQAETGNYFQFVE